MLSEQIYNLPVRLRAAARMPAAQVLARVARRVPFLDNQFVRRLDLRHDPRLRQYGTMREWLARNEALAAEALGWAPLDFRDARVLEVGPGPLAGWGPLALYRGAAAFLGVEPGWDARAFFQPAVHEPYLAGVHADFVARGEAGPPLDDFLARFIDRFEIFAGGIEAVEASAPFDIVLSNSCLEHIRDFPAAVRRLSGLAHDGTRFLHLVNFSNHRDKARPFARLYEMPPEAYRHRYGEHINLLRPSDIQSAFAAAGIAARYVPVDVWSFPPGTTLHPWWTERYPPDELKIRTALFLSPA